MRSIGGQLQSSMIIALFVLACASLGNCSPDTNLFYGDQNVISLNNTSFETAVMNQKHITICAFYTHWCAHCQKTMPIISQFATKIRSWNQVIKIAGVNGQINNQLAKKVNVDYFPRFYYVPAKTLEFGQIRDLSIFQTTNITQNEMKMIVLNLIKNDANLMRVHSLNPILVNQKRELCSILSEVDRSIEQFIVVERKPSNFSLMLLLELMPYKDTMQIIRIYGNDRLLPSLVKSPIDQIAIMRMDVGPCSFQLFMMNPNQDIDAVKSKFSPFIQIGSQISNIENEIIPAENLKEAKKVIKYKLSYVDLHNALRHMLLIEIPLVNVFNEKQVTVIKQLFIMIHKYFPFRNENVKRLFKRMNIWLAKKTSNVSSVDYLEKMAISDGFLKPIESWRHCNGSEAIYRGYTCGLWVLFHTLTVNEYNMTLTAANASAGEFKPKHEVLFAIRDYVTTFFRCKECRDNFIIESQDMQQHLYHANSSVMWLWKTHNQVNQRLRGQKGEDPYFPKIQFPTAEQCEECYDDSNRYDQPNVLQYMTNFYSQQTIRNSSPAQFSLSLFLSMLIVVQSFRLIIPGIN